jgi:chromosome partitioning protein
LTVQAPQRVATGITLTAFKGGQAKSTTALNLAAILARRGHRTLLVDCDPQCNSSGILVRYDEVKFSLRSAIVEKVPVDQVIQRSRIDNLDVLPASFELSILDKEMVVSANGHTRIDRALRPVRSRYSFIIFDTAPGLSHLTLGALAASSYFVIPIAPEVWATDGLRLFLAYVSQEQEEEVFDAQLLGLLATKVEPGTRISRGLLEQLRQTPHLRPFNTTVPKRIGIEDAVRDRRVVGEPGSDPDISAAYEAFTTEVLNRLAQLEAASGEMRRHG